MDNPTTEISVSWQEIVTDLSLKLALANKTAEHYKALYQAELAKTTPPPLGIQESE